MLEKMNTRRWIAVGIAVLILGISAISSGISDKINSEARMKKMEASLMNAVNGMNEEVIEEGDSANRIAVISVEGAIMNVPQASFLTESYDHKATLNALDDILEDDTIKGVLLKVNSPGGGVYESAELHKRIKAIVDAKKPVYVAMGNTAASGGYYISAPATKIYAAPSTLTGSIGVIMGGTNLSGLMDKLGITNQTIKSAAHKDIGSNTRPKCRRRSLRRISERGFPRTPHGHGHPAPLGRRIRLYGQAVQAKRPRRRIGLFGRCPRRFKKGHQMRQPRSL